MSIRVWGLMLRGILLLVGLMISAGTATAQHCTACAAADACIAIYKQGMAKVREDLRAGIKQTEDLYRDLKLDEGDLVRRATERLKANASLFAKYEVDILKRCLNEIR